MSHSDNYCKYCDTEMVKHSFLPHPNDMYCPKCTVQPCVPSIASIRGYTEALNEADSSKVSTVYLNTLLNLFNESQDEVRELRSEVMFSEQLLDSSEFATKCFHDLYCETYLLAQTLESERDELQDEVDEGVVSVDYLQSWIDRAYEMDEKWTKSVNREETLIKRIQELEAEVFKEKQETLTAKSLENQLNKMTQVAHKRFNDINELTTRVNDLEFAYEQKDEACEFYVREWKASDVKLNAITERIESERYGLLTSTPVGWVVSNILDDFESDLDGGNHE